MSGDIVFIYFFSIGVGFLSSLHVLHSLGGHQVYLVATTWIGIICKEKDREEQREEENRL
jgi:hypothetical protein